MPTTLNRAQRRAGWLTPENIENPARKSGYDHVSSAARGTLGGTRAPNVRWRASSGGSRANGAKATWRGPVRGVARQAAQDYCDYINGNQITTVSLRSAGHPKAERKAVISDRAKELRAELAQLEREEREAQIENGDRGSTYLVAEEGNSKAFKIGKTWMNPPEARLAGLQTGNPRKLIMLASKPGSDLGCADDEKELHARFIKNNDFYGEWFSPCKEMFDEFGLKYPLIVGEKAPE